MNPTKATVEFTHLPSSGAGWIQPFLPGVAVETGGFTHLARGPKGEMGGFTHLVRGPKGEMGEFTRIVSNFGRWWIHPCSRIFGDVAYEPIFGVPCNALFTISDLLQSW